MAKSPKWSDVKRRLKELEPQELVELVKDLFDASPENRRLLAARFLQDDLGPELLEPFRVQIHASFFTRSGWPREPLRLTDARKAIRDYRKVTGDVQGTIDLLLSFVETGTDFTREYGGIDSRFYNSLTSALNEIDELLGGGGDPLYANFRDRLWAVADASRQIGWGYGDYVNDVVAELDDSWHASDVSD